MQREFMKMHGCGNDYIFFDCLTEPIAQPAALSVRLSDRHFSIGGDGIVLIRPSDRADAAMRMFNADGSEGRMCGNAIRCVGKYLYDSGRCKKERLTVDTPSGVKTLSLTVRNGAVEAVRVDMGRASLRPADLPVLWDGERVVDAPVSVDGRPWRITCVSMGNPHCVVFVGDVRPLDLERLGPPFERATLFPERVNTEFVHVADRHTLDMRVWERGSGETWACGTGACASAVAAVENGFCPKDEDLLVRLRGGELTIRYTDETVYMAGPAELAFTGFVEL